MPAATRKREQTTLDDSFLPNKKQKKEDASDEDAEDVDMKDGENGHTSEGSKTKTKTKQNGAGSATANRSATAYIKELPGKIATASAAAKVDKDPPLGQLEKRLEGDTRDVGPGESVVYWMRMEDMRLNDNHAIAFASKHAKQHKIPLVVLFVLSPGDYKSHDRAPRRIDFLLRNLRILKESLAKMNVPLQVHSVTPRKKVPEFVRSFVQKAKATHVFANMEYEVDELRRDIAVFDLFYEDKDGLKAEFLHDKLVVKPNVLATKTGNVYAVYSPWLRSWTAHINEHSGSTLKTQPSIEGNDKSARSNGAIKDLFSDEGSKIPESVKGFELEPEDAKKMEELWPAGEEAAMKVFDAFLSKQPSTEQVGDAEPIDTKGAPAKSKSGKESSRLDRYDKDRSRCDLDSSSRMSPYLASGIVSPRTLISTIHEKLGQKNPQGKVNPDRSTPAGSYISEIAWRDFYTHVLVGFPRVSMGRPYLEKFSDVQWEKDADSLKAWKEGRTGVPIVDAGMRQANSQGWMHNRARMICAMYLTKDLMIDWRLGEAYFMSKFIDGDLASNNGGWQWSASTGTDPQPYFRVFNPYAQAEKADPTGEYIRHFVPELKHLKGKALYNPYEELEKSAFKKLGYPEPLVNHKEARERALRRYKNPGEE